MDLDPDLARAYRRTDYVVFGEPELVIHVGEPSADLDALMESVGATSAAYLTAANPYGEQQSEEENSEAADELLAHDLLRLLPRYEGEGRDPLGKWPAEPSVLVLGITREDAEALGRRYAQLAIVFAEKGRAPELVALE